MKHFTALHSRYHRDIMTEWRAASAFMNSCSSLSIFVLQQYLIQKLNENNSISDTTRKMETRIFCYYFHGNCVQPVIFYCLESYAKVLDNGVHLRKNQIAALHTCGAMAHEVALIRYYYKATFQSAESFLILNGKLVHSC